MFTWLKALVGRGTQTLSLVSPWLQNITWTLKRAYLELARDAYGANSIVYACLRLLTTSVAEPPLLAYTLDAKLEKTPLPFDDPLMRLIRNPNPLQSEYQFWEMVGLHAVIGGRSHWWKQRDNVGRIKYLWPIRPDRVAPLYAGKGTDTTMPKADNPVLAGWSYVQPGLGEPVRLALDDVLTFSFPNPAGETGGLAEGLSPLEVLAREIESDNEATAFAAALLKNSATPGIILRIKQGVLTPQQARDVKRRFLSQFGGVRRGEPAVLDADTEITQLGFSLRDLDFSSLRDVSESRIAAVLGVPAILVGLKVGLESGIRATIAEQREYFAETTLSNLWRRFSDQYTKDVAAEYGDDIICRFDMTQVKALAKQLAAQSEPLVTGFQRGAVTIDEYRVRVLQLPALENAVGDSLLVSTLTVATATDEDEAFLDDTEEGDDSEVSGDGDAESTGPRVKPVARATMPRNATAPRVGASRSGKTFLVPAHPLALPSTAAPAARKAVAAPPHATRDDDEARVAEALSSLFDDLAPDVARKIAAGVPVSDDELADAFARVLTPLLAEIAAQEGVSLADRYGVSFDPAEVSAAASEWAASYVPGGLAKGLAAMTQKVVAAALQTYQATPGMTQADLVKTLQPAVSKGRATAIASTEVTRAAAQAVSAYQARLADAGVAMTRVWRTNNDEKTCVVCQPLNGKVESAWPDEVKNGPPAHTLCRCAVSLVLDETEAT